MHIQVSGCDITLAFFGTGKVKAIKVLQTCQKMRTDVTAFGEKEATKSEIAEVGMEFIGMLYTGEKWH